MKRPFHMEPSPFMNEDGVAHALVSADGARGFFACWLDAMSLAHGFTPAAEVTCLTCRVRLHAATA